MDPWASIRLESSTERFCLQQGGGPGLCQRETRFIGNGPFTDTGDSTQPP